MAVYLDHAATTPVRSEVAGFLAQAFGVSGNASSVHQFGQRAKLELEQARERIGAVLDCHPSEVIFTSGGTEANNLAVFGLFQARNKDADRPVVLTLPTEHHAVLEAVDSLEQNSGATVLTIPVGASGQPDLAWLDSVVDNRGAEIALVCAMVANNETGVVVDVAGIVEICKRLQIPVHTDAVAAVGHLPLSFRNLGVDTLAFTGHKLGAPVGIGALLVARAAKVTPRFHGGSQERGIRPGTQDVIGANALALAVELAAAELPANRANWEILRARLIDGVLAAVPEAVLVGVALDSTDTERLSNIVDFVFHGCAGDSLLFLLDSAGIAISNGSACTAGVTSASHVLVAMGYSQADASSCVRVSFGADTRESDIDAFLTALPEAHRRAKLAGFTTL